MPCLELSLPGPGLGYRVIVFGEDTFKGVAVVQGIGYQLAAVTGQVLADPLFGGKLGIAYIVLGFAPIWVFKVEQIDICHRHFLSQYRDTIYFFGSAMPSRR
jgi:hypothetical protein